MYLGRGGREATAGCLGLIRRSLSSGRTMHGMGFVSAWTGAVGPKQAAARRISRSGPRHVRCSASPSSHAAIQRMEEGPKFNQVVVHDRVAYLSGQVPPDPSDQTVRGQTLQILGRIDQLLDLAGTDKSRLLTVSVWLKEAASFAEFNAAWDEWLDFGNKPTRAVVESKLAKEEWLIEIAATAAVPTKPEIISTDKAAAAVGPYNQAIRMEDGLIFVSGCIGLKPGSGEMAGDSIEEQTDQVLSNMREILAAAGAGSEHVVKTTILLEDIGDFSVVNNKYKAFFGEGPVPARSTFAVKALPKGAKVEIECIASVS